MADNFHQYIKKQLIDYVEAERKKGVPLADIEKVLLNAGHDKNIIDETLAELRQEESGQKPAKHKEVEGDIMAQLKGAFSQFMTKASDKQVKEAKEEVKDSEKIIEEVIEETEVIEEKTMLESAAFIIYVVLIGLIVLVSAGATDSSPVNVAIAFSPVLINAFIALMALQLADNVPLYAGIPLVIAAIFYALGRFTNLPVLSGFEMEALAVVVFVLGFIFNITLVYIRFIKPESMKRKVIFKPAPQPAHPATVKEAKAEIKKDIEEIKKDREEIKDLKKEFNL